MSNTFLESLFGMQGQVAVVIGGTGTLGGALAEGLAQAGAHVVIAGSNAERGSLRVAAIEELGGSASFLEVNATQRESIGTLLRESLKITGSVEMLVNCAGVNSAVPYAEISDEDWRRVVDGNLTSTHLACQQFAPRMATQPREIGRAHV